MRTRQARRVEPSTIDALKQRKNGYTLRGLALALGLDENENAMLSNVLKDKPGALTQAGENDLRRRLGLPPIALYEVPPCPSCGSVHTGDCHGRPVAAVVVLAPGERVTVARKAQKRKRYHCPCLDDDEWRDFLEWRASRK